MKLATGPDPKLQLVAEEIKAICRKHDIAAIMTLVNESASEIVRELTPTWSCARIEEHQGKAVIRVRCIREDFPSKAAQKHCLEQTIGMLIAFEHHASRDADGMRQMIQMLGQKVEIQSILKDVSPLDSAGGRPPPPP